MIRHVATGPYQNLCIEGGRLGHHGLEAIGGITISGGSRRRDRYARLSYDLRESQSSPVILSPSFSWAPPWVVT